ncbi:metal-dependent hydrolase [Salarchaeum sp. JOR-1]|uniref:metal-dependent hydrolase n=1 Tax=Salarchaeum sp. JOR-1 TaxID=2599399 RepID=UPI0011988027|nr:metal-dependent hydrolase [Salarchaeum sp. JOR-1]QDX41699.1 metal-dependent hydrolase [Salarchaeum sp. JOR-1]
MFVGHETLAFALVALAALRLGRSRPEALALGVAAGAFAAVPDVDMVYAPAGLLGLDSASAFAAANAFWSASTVVHRAMTHSVVVAVPAALGFALAAHDSRTRLVAAPVLLALVGVAAVASGALGAFVMAVYVAAGALVAVLAARRLALAPREVAAVALAGLVSHPFGDLFTGEAPQFLYPLSGVVFDGRLALAADPTLHLLGAFGVELAAIWLGVLTYLHLTERSPWRHLNVRAAGGAAYALAAFVIAPPTLDTSYQFVFSVLAVGFVGVVPDWKRRLPPLSTATITGLAAITVAGLAYAVAYVAA